MACEKQKDRITALALGELHPKRELELLAHAGECDACREAYEHAARVRDGVERGVESLVAGEPSPHFAARLRARIAAEPAPARMPWLKWTPVAAATLALAALLAALMLRIQEPRHSIAPDVSALAPAATPIAPSNPPASEPVASVVQVTRPRHTVVRAAAPSPRLASQEPEIPPVLVPPGQLAAALKLSDALSEKPADGQQLVAAANKAAEPLKINDLSVPPLDKPVPLADSTEDPGSF